MSYQKLVMLAVAAAALGLELNMHGISESSVIMYENPPPMFLLFQQNPHLSTFGVPARVQPGAYPVTMDVTPLEGNYVWEYTGFFTATETREYTFSASKEILATLQFGFETIDSQSHLGMLLAKPDCNINSNTYCSLTDGATFMLQKGMTVPMRVIFTSGSSKHPIHVSSSDGGTREVNGEIEQAIDASTGKTQSVLKNSTDYPKRLSPESHIHYSKLGYNVACFAASKDQKDSGFPQNLSSLRKLYEGRLEATSTCLPGERVIVPEAIVVTGHMQPSKSGHHSFFLDRNLIASIQFRVGAGLGVRAQLYSIGREWKIMDTRLLNTSMFSLNLLQGLFYPYRIAVLGNETGFKSDITQLNPLGQEEDLLWIWNPVFSGPSLESEESMDNLLEEDLSRSKTFVGRSLGDASTDMMLPGEYESEDWPASDTTEISEGDSTLNKKRFLDFFKKKKKSSTKKSKPASQPKHTPKSKPKSKAKTTSKPKTVSKAKTTSKFQTASKVKTKTKTKTTSKSKTISKSKITTTPKPKITSKPNTTATLKSKTILKPKPTATSKPKTTKVRSTKKPVTSSVTKTTKSLSSRKMISNSLTISHTKALSITELTTAARSTPKFASKIPKSSFTKPTTTRVATASIQTSSTRTLVSSKSSASRLSKPSSTKPSISSLAKIDLELESVRLRAPTMLKIEPESQYTETPESSEDPKQNASKDPEILEEAEDESFEEVKEEEEDAESLEESETPVNIENDIPEEPDSLSEYGNDSSSQQNEFADSSGEMESQSTDNSELTEENSLIQSNATFAFGITILASELTSFLSATHGISRQAVESLSFLFTSASITETLLPSSDVNNIQIVSGALYSNFSGKSTLTEEISGLSYGGSNTSVPDPIADVYEEIAQEADKRHTWQSNMASNIDTNTFESEPGSLHSADTSIVGSRKHQRRASEFRSPISDHFIQHDAAINFEPTPKLECEIRSAACGIVDAVSVGDLELIYLEATLEYYVEYYYRYEWKYRYIHFGSEEKPHVSDSGEALDPCTTTQGKTKTEESTDSIQVTEEPTESIQVIEKPTESIQVSSDMHSHNMSSQSDSLKNEVTTAAPHTLSIEYVIDERALSVSVESMSRHVSVVESAQSSTLYTSDWPISSSKPNQSRNQQLGTSLFRQSSTKSLEHQMKISGYTHVALVSENDRPTSASFNGVFANTTTGYTKTSVTNAGLPNAALSKENSSGLEAGKSAMVVSNSVLANRNQTAMASFSSAELTKISTLPSQQSQPASAGLPVWQGSTTSVVMKSARQSFVEPASFVYDARAYEVRAGYSYGLIMALVLLV